MSIDGAEISDVNEQQQFSTETSSKPNIERRSWESLPDLTQEYTFVRHLGSGANDSGYLMESPTGEPVVGLTPNNALENHWGITQGKLRLVGPIEQDDPEMAQYLIHEIAKGQYRFPNTETARPLMVIEYAGESLDTLQNNADKYEAIRQVHDCIQRLHNTGRAINDFKDDHWKVQVDRDSPDNPIKVKLIDNTKIRADNGPTPTRYLDLIAYTGFVKNQFPWYRLPPEFNEPLPVGEDKYEAYKARVDRMLVDLKEQQSLSGNQRAIERLKRGMGVKRK
jgi:hypothetical protein